jgi:hypothetical protein
MSEPEQNKKEDAMSHLQRRTASSIALLVTFLMFCGLVQVEKAFAGPISVRVTGTFLSPEAAKEGVNVIVFYYRGIDYPFRTDEVKMMDSSIKEATGKLREIGQPNIIVYGGEGAVAAISEHGTVGNKYTLEGTVYVADRIFQIHSATFIPKSK